MRAVVSGGGGGSNNGNEGGGGALKANLRRGRWGKRPKAYLEIGYCVEGHLVNKAVVAECC